ncbi:MAG: NADH-quinone oxidoreductase subunit L [Thermodesulfobacteriota bacterium]|nr:NADH-quinone oxidoreductase subunit L [Thermodesulfobacteriota bacterium]
MLDYVWLVPIFPVIGVLINGLLGHKLSNRLVGFVACSVIFLSFVLSVLLFLSLLKLPPEARSFEKIVYTWIATGDFKTSIGFLVDPLSIIMMLVVSGVSFLIHVYSVGYMHDDEGYTRYFTYLNLFVFSMLVLVCSNNFLLMFVGWEGVGLCSYLLIGFWYERKEPADAGKKAFVVNRIGDYGFLLGMMLIFVTFGTLNFSDVFEKAGHTFNVGNLTITAITLLLFVGATGKSAQIPLYTWLPDAMEGPTPVSALIHAATMVTAGVYMVVRCNILFTLAPISLTVVAIVGVVTAVFTASIALTANDIKRVLAYSTISQLGYMFLACGVGAYAAGVFHLMTHAFFKALLFLGAGSVMHAMAGELDMRKMGALKSYMPKTYGTFLIATLAIAGIFPFAGFFSKDEILWYAFQKSTILWALGAGAALMTAFYMFRAVFMTFLGESRVDEEVKKHLHESPPVMTNPLIVLAVLSTIGGLVGIPIIKGWNVFHDFLAPVTGGHAVESAKITLTNLAYASGSHVSEAEAGHHSIGLEVLMMMVSLAIAGIGIALAYYMYIKNPSAPKKLTQRFALLYQLIFNRYFVDEIYDFLFVNPIKRGSTLLWQIFDAKFIDGIVNGVGHIVKWSSIGLRRIQTGYVQNYALSILIGVGAIIVYFLYI